jgi:Tol biopolymer transport system component
LPLAAGTRLGPYDVIALLGEGGMGQVYRATDTNLKRAVALKVLPESVAADADRLARFQREAEVLAALNHPNIAAIYGVERLGSSPVLVMELVEGPTLADRIAAGPLAPQDIRLIARQIAEALEAAHERGIVHRDLKPANIKVRPDDAVKVLDFGLAKQGDGSGASNSSASRMTMTSPAMTQAGMILGTAAYMSPEQAKGRAVDRRADVWAFGAVLYEMLTGQRAFAGDDVTEVLASVLAREPDWSKLPASTPVLNAVVRRCLERDQRQRFGDMQSVRLALDGAFGSGIASAVSGVSAAAAESGVRRTRAASSMLPWLLAGASLVAALVFGAMYYRRPAAADSAVIKTTIAPPEGAVFDFDVTVGPPVLSPNGKYIAFSARSGDNRIQLWLRPLDSIEARSIDGTDGAAFPFWSPDSQSLGFYDTPKGRIERVDIAGGAPIPVVSAGYVRGASWGPDGTILFDASDRGGGIFEVPASGGTPKPLLPNTISHQPWILPDGRHYLYYLRETRTIHVASRDDKADAVVAEATTGAIYASGHLLFMRDNTLVSQPFDASRLVLTGSPVSIARGVQTLLGDPRGLFSASENGLLVYQDAPPGPASSLVWFDANGKRLSGVAELASARGVRLSPNGLFVTMGLTAPDGRTDLWRTELATGRQARLTFENDGNVSSWVAWSHDGQWIAYGVKRDGRTLVVRRPSAGGPEEIVATLPPKLVKDSMPRVGDWTRSGDILLSEITPGGIWRVPVAGAGATASALSPVIKTSDEGHNARVSPNGRWLVYQAALGDATTSTVLIEALPSGGHRHQVSDHASLPVWSADGHALYYALDNILTMVSVTEADGTLQFGPPRPLMPVIIGRGYSYDISKDGRILALVTSEARAARALTLVQGWVR